MEKKNPKQMTDEEKSQKALLKSQRRAEYEAKFKKEAKTDDGKTKSQLRAERRAKQEAQRAAKFVTKDQTPESSKSERPLSDKVTSIAKYDLPDTNNQTYTKQDSRIPGWMVSHLPRRVSNLSDLSVESIPPEVVKIGYKINKNIIDDPNARCVAMLMAFQKVIKEYQPKKDIKRELQDILFTDSYNFLDKCRPLSISMINATKYLKLIFSRTSSELKDSELRINICNAIDTFIKEEIICSREAIVENSLKKIFPNENETILTLGCSSIIQKVFLDAFTQGIKFKVVVVDTRPRFEGRKMVRFLTQHKIPVTYILINAIMYIMKEVNKVMFEAHSVLCSGYVMSTIGSSQIALVAQAYNIPVVVCCETYKYSDRAYTDCFIHNELGPNSESFSSLSNSLSDSTVSSNLNFLDLFYDLTPREFISAVITEKGFLPCTSVPAILRFRETIK